MRTVHTGKTTYVYRTYTVARWLSQCGRLFLAPLEKPTQSVADGRVSSTALAALSCPWSADWRRRVQGHGLRDSVYRRLWQGRLSQL